MSTAVAITRPSSGELMEQVITKGDLSKLTPQERSQYYMQVCTSVGLNPLTKPFEYITLNGKLTLYALRTCTDQLRSIYKVSVVDLIETERDGVFIVTAKMQNGEGRTDMAKGAVTINGLKGDALANAIMKAETKAKRRATLSLCGLGMLDETEVETIPAGVVGNGAAAEAQKSNSVRQMMRDDVKDMTGMSEKDMRDLYMALLAELKAEPPDQIGDFLKSRAGRINKLPMGWQQTLQRNVAKRLAVDEPTESDFDVDQWLRDLDGALSGCETAAEFDHAKNTIMLPAKNKVSGEDWLLGEKIYGRWLGQFMGPSDE